ncbi:uncharacterized protein N7473_001607 [Penicillium subrubescens]|uniref:uncharacterized protein n=1 Tax=Penicillium subrubescens TaxID=1316194 RepID=UPI002545105F|nr:uncharacterized protein N7473_001607 [Penicillium subrubescens]KAJ5904691.1 hypothetical protein N7473_001607 [Penicillium subrubescens]
MSLGSTPNSAVQNFNGACDAAVARMTRRGGVLALVRERYIRKLLTPASLGVENPSTAASFVGMPTARHNATRFAYVQL